MKSVKDTNQKIFTASEREQLTKFVKNILQMCLLFCDVRYNYTRKLINPELRLTSLRNADLVIAGFVLPWILS